MNSPTLNNFLLLGKTSTHATLSRVKRTFIL